MIENIGDKPVQEYQLHSDKVKQQVHKGTTGENTASDKGAEPEVVSKDFILNLLSLAIGKPYFLEGNSGKKIDVRV
ncbi:MAG: hypothetical protein ACOC7U_09050 [Spirochaetota bacterium]